MKDSNDLVKLPQISQTMRAMSAEMMKVSSFLSLWLPEDNLWFGQAGIMEEMMEDIMPIEDDELEEEADAEVDKILFELTDGKLGVVGAVGGALPVSRSSQIHYPVSSCSAISL
jgi:charged multivesicular body protein 3